MLPAAPRLPDVQALIDEKQYFLLHAPRQSGKTTSIKSFVRKINDDGLYYALYYSLEHLTGITDSALAMSRFRLGFNMAIKTCNIDAHIGLSAEAFLDELKSKSEFEEFSVQLCLSSLSKKLDKDLVVFFDEADSLNGQPLLDFLTQLRIGYVNRDETSFPRSIALIGMVSIEDYKASIRPQSETLDSGSPFNIITEALTLADFTPEEVRALYAQHTEATGQAFEGDAVGCAWYWSEGQPWLVNALAREAVAKILAKNYSQAVTADHIDQAADHIMRRRDTHLLSLMARLKEPRVRRFVEPMLSLSEEVDFAVGIQADPYSHDDDEQYCFDLGLLKQDGRLRPANPIYASVISRYLNSGIQRKIQGVDGKWMDGQSLDMTGLLKGFQGFWAEKAEKFMPGLLYLEAGPHCLLTAFLQRAAGGGATVIPEYASGLGYEDIVVKYAGRNYPIELKLKDVQKSRAKSERQLLGYMERLLADEGWLVVFDRKSKKSWPEKIFWKTVTPSKGKTIHLVGC